MLLIYLQISINTIYNFLIFTITAYIQEAQKDFTGIVKD